MNKFLLPQRISFFSTLPESYYFYTFHTPFLFTVLCVIFLTIFVFLLLLTPRKHPSDGPDTVPSFSSFRFRIFFVRYPTSSSLLVFFFPSRSFSNWLSFPLPLCSSAQVNFACSFHTPFLIYSAVCSPFLSGLQGFKLVYFLWVEILFADRNICYVMKRLYESILFWSCLSYD